MIIEISEDELNTRLDTKVTLECPVCHVHYTMTIKGFFDKMNYNGLRKRRLKCEICQCNQNLFFINVNPATIVMAAFRYRRKYGR